MVWFRVDDSFGDHPKVKSIPRVQRRQSVALWTLAGSWAARHLAEGLVPEALIEDLGCVPKDAAALVASGLWHIPGHDCDRCEPVPVDHFLYHDWGVYQRSKEEVLAERKASTERQRKARLKARESRRDSGVTHAVSSDVTSDDVTVPPTRPDPTQSLSTSVGTESGGSVETGEPPHFCSKHPNGADGPCGGCADARRIWQAWDVARMKREDAERVAVAAYNCSRCEGTGFIEDPITHDPIDKCNHLRSVS